LRVVAGLSTDIATSGALRIDWFFVLDRISKIYSTYFFIKNLKFSRKQIELSLDLVSSYVVEILIKF
jgi:hypothetical protein